MCKRPSVLAAANQCLAPSGAESDYFVHIAASLVFLTLPADARTVKLTGKFEIYSALAGSQLLQADRAALATLVKQIEKACLLYHGLDAVFLTAWFNKGDAHLHKNSEAIVTAATQELRELGIPKERIYSEIRAIRGSDDKAFRPGVIYGELTCPAE